MAFHPARIAEPVRELAFKRIGIARAEDLSNPVHGDLQMAREHQPDLLALMAERRLSGIGTGLVDLADHLECAPRAALANLAVGDFSAPDLHQILGFEEKAALGLGLIGEKLRQPDGQAVENPFERADGGIAAARFDQGYRGVRQADPFGERALRDPARLPQAAQPPADIDLILHPCLP